MQRILVTGGRAPATLELARTLRAGGCEVFVAESLPLTLAALSSHVTRAFRVPQPRQEPEAFAYHLLDICRRHAVDTVWGTCEEIFHLVRYRHVLEPHVQVFAPSLEQIRRLHHKGEFTAWIQELGLDAPQTEVVTNKDALRRRIAASGPDLVAKPAWSRFATQARVGPTDTSWIDQVQVNEATPWVIQERLQGTRCCTWSVLKDGKVLVHTAYPMSWHQGTGASLHWQSLRSDTVEDWVVRFAKATGLTGQVAFDLFIHPTRGVLPIECNPRLTSGVHLLGGDARLAQAIRGELDDTLRPDSGHTAGIKLGMVLYSRPEIRAQGFGKSWSTWRQARDVLWSWRDPLPTLLHWLSYVTLIRRGWRLGLDPMSASTWDIEWNGEV